MPDAPTTVEHVGLGASSSDLADTIATTSPAGAVEVRAAPDERTVGTGGAAGTSASAKFTFEVERDPTTFGRAFLVYDLTGLASFTAPVRSINGSRPLGGFRPTAVVDGGVQVEEIPPAALHRGSNTIEFFPTSKDDVSGYKVAHLRVVFVADTRSAAPNGAHADLVITHPLHGECSGGTAYVRGFVTPAANASGLATVLVDGKRIPSALESDGSFSVAVQPPNLESSSFSFEIAGVYPDGTSVSRPVTVDGCDDGALGPGALSSVAHARGRLVEDPSAPFGAVVTPWAPKTLSFGGATIEIPAGAVDKTVRVTIRPLPASQLAKMNEGMKNVTPGSGGYRFGPHGLTFKAPITIRLPVDDALLPAGKDHEDVRAFFYDEDDGRWKSVGRVPPERGKNKKSRAAKHIGPEVASQTTHFTDFVNATLAVPEHPTAESFNENMMKDMKLGDPAAGVTLIEPPTANSFGSANLSYPIEVPPGRNGIQPELAIRYNSDNTQDGWLGVGWDLTLPSIEVDTRFGAPAYDTANETESYLFGGEALAPTAKRDSPDPRSGSQKTFFRRVEGKFDRIVRIGSSPADYHWEVTDQRGTKFKFGSTSASRLEAYTGAPKAGVFRWYLESVVDTFGNEMDVTYVHDNGNNGEPYTQIYPQSITYTSSQPNNLAPAYSVAFDLQPRCDANSSFCDQMITGRPGFQVKTNSRLQDIRVLQGPTPQTGHLIRQYNLRYTEGDFHKTLLQGVDQLGKSGTVLGTHNFTYDLRKNDPLVPSTASGASVFNLFDPAQTWGSVNRQSGGLTSSEDQSSGGGASVGIGLGSLSLTGDGGGFGGDETTHASFLDQNGNGLPDLLEDSGQGSFNSLVSRAPPTGTFTVATVAGLGASVLGSGTPPFGGFGPPNLGGFGAFVFGAGGSLGHTNRSGWHAGADLNLGVVDGAVSYSHTNTDDDHVVSDIDGDGFPDLLSVDDDGNLQALINDGHGGFAVPGPNAPPFGAVNPTDVTPVHPKVDAKFATNQHKIDPLLRWVAPFAGTVILGNPITKRNAGGDGVEVQIFVQRSSSTSLLWRHQLIDDPVTHQAPSCVPTKNCEGSCAAGSFDGCNGGTPLDISVLPNDRVYMKVDSGDDTHSDDLDWDATFTYQVDPSLASLREPFGPNVYRFSMKDDFRLSGMPTLPWTASADGTVSIQSVIDSLGTLGAPSISKKVTSDDVEVHIVKTDTAGNTTELLNPPFKLAANDARTTPIPIPIPNQPFRVNQGDMLTLSLLSDTPVDPAMLSWFPVVHYDRFTRIDPNTGNHVEGSVTCDPGIPSTGCHICQNPSDGCQDPMPDEPISIGVIQQLAQVFHGPTPTSVPTLVPSSGFPGGPSYPSFQYLPMAAQPGSTPVPAGTPPEATQGYVSSGTVTVDASTIFSTVPGVAIVNGVDANGNSRLIAKATLTGAGTGNLDPGTDSSGEVVFTFYSSSSPGIVTWAPTLNNGSIHAPVNFRYVDQANFGNEAAFLGLGPISPVDPMSGGYHRWFFGDWDATNTPSFDPAGVVTPTQNGFNVFFPLAPQAQGIRSSNGLPVWVGRGQGEFVAAGSLKPAHATGTGNSGHGLGSADSLRAVTTTNTDTNVNVGSIAGAGYNWGSTSAENDFLDMNGDRFPDAVYLDGSRLNTGTTLNPSKDGHHFDDFATSCDPSNVFCEPFNTFLGFNTGEIRKIEHRTVRAGASFDPGDNKLINQTDTDGNDSKFITTGFDFGVDYGFSATHVDLVDINGDGLPDHVRRDSSHDNNQILVELNLGYAFSKPIPWATDPWVNSQPTGAKAGEIIQQFSDAVTANVLRLQDTAGANGGLGGNLGGVVGGGGGATVSQSRTLVDLVDVNGDGLPDQVMKDPKDKQFKVKLNLGDRFAPEEEWNLPNWQSPIPQDQSILNLLAQFIDAGESDPDALAFTRSKSSTESVHAQVCIGVCIGGSFFHEQGSSFSQMSFEDIDGDGKLDHVLKLDNGKEVFVKRNHSDKSNLLVSFSRPLGGAIALDYRRDGNRVSAAGPGLPNDPDMPNNQWVLASTQVNDGQGSGLGHDFRTVFLYGDGIYNRFERENQGYDRVTTVRYRPDGTIDSTVEERFINGSPATLNDGSADPAATSADPTAQFYLRGRLIERVERATPSQAWINQVFGTPPQPPLPNPQDPLRPVVAADGLIFARTTTLWRLASVTDGSSFPKDETDTTYFYEGTTTDVNAFQKSTHQLRVYDDTSGNVTDFTDFGEEGTGADDVVYHVDYFTDSAQYIIRPSDVIAKDSATPGNVLRRRDAIYGSHGELTKLTMLLSGGIDPTTNAPYSGASNPEWNFTYDNFGNVFTVTAPGKTQADQHTVSYLYDDVAQTYRKQITDNDFGYISTSIPNLDFGTVDTTTDVNGQSEHFDYDEFGRLTQVFGPRDIGLSNPTIRIDYSFPTKGVSTGSPAYAVTHHKDEQHLTPAPFGDPIDTSVFIDGLKRVLQTKKDLERDNGAGITTVGFAVSGKVVFDARGRVSDQSQPRFCTPAGDADCDTGPNGTPADITTYVKSQRERNPTHFDYDVLSRVILVRTPDQGITTTAYGFGSPAGDPTLRRTKSVTDPNLKVRVFYQSVRDEIFAVQEHNTINGQSKTLLTTYTYDPLSELLTVADAKNNPTTATYDTLGRMVSLTNKDTGQVNYRFDLAGNLAAKETPNLHAANQLIRRVYSHGRLTDIVYPTSKSVHFSYGPQNPTPGVPNDANGNVSGRIASIDDESGHQDFFYGSMGELVKESRRLFSVRNEKIGDDRICDALNCDQDGNPLNQFEHDCSKPPTYVTQFKRDSFDRLLELVYPDGEDMKYQYDFGGSLNGVTSTIPVPNTTQCQLVHAQPTNATYVSHIGYDEFGQRENIFLGNGVTTSYAYDPQMRRLTNVNTNRPDKDSHGNPIVVPLQRLAYSYDLVGNVLSVSNNIPAPTQENFTGPTAFLFAYDDLYQVTAASATYTRESNNLHNEFRQQNLSLSYDEIGNITSKVQVDTDHIDGLTTTEDDTSRAWDYTYAAAGPHQVSQIKWRDPQPRPISQLFNGAHRDYQYDLDGNDKRFDFIEKGETHSEADRLLTWNEEDRLRSASQDGIHIEDTTQNYLYDSDGTRTQRRIGGGSCPDETKYVNQYVVVQNDDVTSKHIYAGDIRIATTLTNEETRECQEPQPVFYFHTDHLQSTEYLTDSAAKIAEHNEYFAFGETWIDERRDLDNDGRQDYLFTGKELDPETNLYYFGARYYDPIASRWEAPDPVLGQQVSRAHNQVGVYAPVHLALYPYARNNPLAVLDPNGRAERAVGEGYESYVGAEDVGNQSIAPNASECTSGGCVSVSPTPAQLGEINRARLANYDKPVESEMSPVDVFAGEAAPIGRLGARAVTELGGVVVKAIARRAVTEGAEAIATGGAETVASEAMNPNILSGHGEYLGGTMQVPEGTPITVWTEHGGTISDELGNAIESSGNISMEQFPEIEGARSYLPRSEMPNYTLHPPTGLNIVGNPTVVSSPTPLSELVGPGMGNVQWAACLYVAP